MDIPYESIAAGVGGILTILKSFSTVKEGQLGSKTVFGKAVRTKDGKIKVIKPGFTILIPLVATLQKTHIKMDSVELDNLSVTMADGLSYQYSAFVAYHVSENPEELETFLYQVDNPHSLISQKLSSEIRELLAQEHDITSVTGSEINKRLSTALATYLKDKVGVTLDSCGITSLTASLEAQQVNTTIAKYRYARGIYEAGPIPQSVVAACFGATPISAPLPYAQERQEERKEEGLLEMLNIK